MTNLQIRRRFYFSNFSKESRRQKALSDWQICHYFISIRAVEISEKISHFSFFATFSRFPHSETASIGLRIIFSSILDLFWNFEKKNFFWPFLGLFGYFFAKQLFSSFLPVNRTINLVIFFLKSSKASP